MKSVTRRYRAFVSRTKPRKVFAGLPCHADGSETSPDPPRNPTERHPVRCFTIKPSHSELGRIKVSTQPFHHPHKLSILLTQCSFSRTFQPLCCAHVSQRYNMHCAILTSTGSERSVDSKWCLCRRKNSDETSLEVRKDRLGFEP
jgi:hypothetical protein